MQPRPLAAALASSASFPPPSWAYRIRVAAWQGDFLHAVALFLRMRSASPAAVPRSSVPVSLPAALKSCAALGLRALGASLHELALRSGAYADRFTANALLSLYCKPGLPPAVEEPAAAASETVQKVFDEMPEKDVVSWNTLVLGCAENGMHQEALRMVREMWRDGFKLDSFTLSSVLPIFAERADVRRGMEVHGFATRNGFDDDVFVGSGLIDLYANCTRHCIVDCDDHGTCITWFSKRGSCVV